MFLHLCCDCDVDKIRNIGNSDVTPIILSGGAGAVVRSLPLDPKVPGSIHGSAEKGIFGDLLSR